MEFGSDGASVSRGLDTGPLVHKRIYSVKLEEVDDNWEKMTLQVVLMLIFTSKNKFLYKEYLKIQCF